MTIFTEKNDIKLDIQVDENKLSCSNFRFVFTFVKMQKNLKTKIVLKHCIIRIFLIHSGSVQKMLTALLKLVWKTQDRLI